MWGVPGEDKALLEALEAQNDEGQKHHQDGHLKAGQAIAGQEKKQQPRDESQLQADQSHDIAHGSSEAWPALGPALTKI
jgi:hypothetical protein